MATGWLARGQRNREAAGVVWRSMQVTANTYERQRVKLNKSPVEAICIHMGLVWD